MKSILPAAKDRDLLDGEGVGRGGGGGGVELGMGK
jgi:hypothetical protein